MAKTKTIFTYGLFAMSLLVFGFYSTTMNYAYAVTSSTFTVTSYDLRGSTYNDANNSWYFASPNNNTMIRLPNNTTTPTSLPVNGNSNCVDPIDILSLEYDDDAYIALWCDNGAVATHGLMIRDRVTNQEKDFEANIFNTEDAFIMVEWVAGDKLYVANHGSSPTPSIAIFNLQAINSTTSTMYAGSIAITAQCPTIYDMVVNEAESEMYVTCTRVTTNTNTIAVVSLFGSVVTEYIALTGTSGTLTLDYNSDTGIIAVADYTANDFWLVDSADSSVDFTSTALCSTGGGISPTFNENTNQIYIMCNVLGTGANSIILFDVPSTSVVATFTGANSPAGTFGGTNYWARQHFESSIGRLYATFGWTQNTGSGAVANSITTIFDDTDAPEDSDTGNQIDGRCGNGTALDCVGDRSTLNQITGGTSWGVLGNSLFGGIGLVNTTNSDIKENGTGLLLMLMLGAFFSSITIGSIAVANNKFGAGISYTEIPKEFWLFLVVGVISVAYYLQWIPDIVFFSMIVGLAGLFSFGLYKHIRGG